MKILHVIKEHNDSRPIEMAELQREQGNEVALLMIHDAVLTIPHTDLETFACRDDVIARGTKTDVQLVDYEAIIRLVFAHDSVTCW